MNNTIRMLLLVFVVGCVEDVEQKQATTASQCRVDCLAVSHADEACLESNDLLLHPHLGPYTSVPDSERCTICETDVPESLEAWASRHASTNACYEAYPREVHCELHLHKMLFPDGLCPEEYQEAMDECTFGMGPCDVTSDVCDLSGASDGYKQPHPDCSGDCTAFRECLVDVERAAWEAVPRGDE